MVIVRIPLRIDMNKNCLPIHHGEDSEPCFSVPNEDVTGNNFKWAFKKGPKRLFRFPRGWHTLTYYPVTLPKFNIAPEKWWWLEDNPFLLRPGLFSGAMLDCRVYTGIIINHEIRIPFKQLVFHGKSPRGPSFFRGTNFKVAGPKCWGLHSLFSDALIVILWCKMGHLQVINGAIISINGWR